MLHLHLHYCSCARHAYCAAPRVLGKRPERAGDAWFGLMGADPVCTQHCCGPPRFPLVSRARPACTQLHHRALYPHTHACRAKASGNPALLAPILPLTIVVAYQADLAYGEKPQRIRAEAERILREQPHLVQLPGGAIRRSTVDDFIGGKRKSLHDV